MMMNTIFQTEVVQGWLSVYMDDIAVHTKREEQEMEQQHIHHHQQYIHHMLNKLEQNDLYLKPEKCNFEQKRNQLPWCHSWQWKTTNGSKETQRCCRLAKTK